MKKYTHLIIQADSNKDLFYEVTLLDNKLRDKIVEQVKRILDIEVALNRED